MAKPLQPSSTNYVRHQLCISPYSPELTIFQVLQLLMKTRHTQDSSQTLMAESIQPSFITLQQRPAFRAIQKKRRGIADIQHLLDLSREFWVPKTHCSELNALAAFARRRSTSPAVRASGEIAQPKYTNELTHCTGWSATINASLSLADAPTPATIIFVLAKLTLMRNAELTVRETVPVPPAQMHAMWQSVQHHQQTQGLNMEHWCSESVLVGTCGHSCFRGNGTAPPGTVAEAQYAITLALGQSKD